MIEFLKKPADLGHPLLSEMSTIKKKAKKQKKKAKKAMQEAEECDNSELDRLEEKRLEKEQKKLEKKRQKMELLAQAANGGTNITTTCSEDTLMVALFSISS